MDIDDSGAVRDPLYRKYVIFRDYADRQGLRRAYEALSTIGADHNLLVNLVARYLAEAGPNAHPQTEGEHSFAYATDYGHVRIVLRWRGRGLAFCSIEPSGFEQWHRHFIDAENWLAQRADLNRVEQIMQAHHDN